MKKIIVLSLFFVVTSVFSEMIQLDSSVAYPAYNCVLNSDLNVVQCKLKNQPRNDIIFKKVYVNCVQGTPGQQLIGRFTRKVAQRPGMSRSCFVYAKGPRE